MRTIIFGAGVLTVGLALLAFLRDPAPVTPEGSEVAERAADIDVEDAIVLEGRTPTEPLAEALPAAPETEDARLRRVILVGDAKALIEALEAVAEQGPSAAGSIEQLIPLLSHADQAVAKAAADALVAIGEAAVDPIVERVVAAFDERGSGAHGTWVMGWGPYVLTQIGAPAVVPVARRLGDAKTYFWAFVTFQSLARSGTQMTDATDVVLERLRSLEDGTQISFVIDAVPSLGRDASRAVPQLVAFLTDPRPQVRLDAVESLGKIGADASSALGDLEHMRERVDPSEGALTHALDEAIAKIRGD